MKFSDEQKQQLLSSMPEEIPQESKHKIIEFIEKITDLFAEDEFTLERLSQFGIACTIVTQVCQTFASDLISEVKDVGKNILKSETMH
jgi:hypothetical protein